MKIPVPSAWWNRYRFDQVTTDGWKIHAIARNVSGIIESSPSTVAKTAPNRIPMYEGMNSNSRPTIEMMSVHHAIGVWIGVKLAVESLNLSTM